MFASTLLVRQEARNTAIRLKEPCRYIALEGIRASLGAGSPKTLRANVCTFRFEPPFQPELLAFSPIHHWILWVSRCIVVGLVAGWRPQGMYLCASHPMKDTKPFSVLRPLAVGAIHRGQSSTCRRIVARTS